MTGKIKALGLSLVAIAAMSAVAASAAQAGKFDVGVQPAVITGQNEGNQVFSILRSTNAGVDETFNAVIPTASFEGTTQGLTVEEATITTTYSGGTLFGQAMTVRLNGCKYTLTGAGQPANTFLLDIVGCTAGQQITFQNATCQIRIPEQNGLSHIVGSEPNPTTTPHTTTLATTITGITHTQFGVCPDGNNHHSNNFTLAGNSIVKAFADLPPTQVTLHGHQYSQLGKGAQTSITST